MQASKSTKLSFPCYPSRGKLCHTPNRTDPNSRRKTKDKEGSRAPKRLAILPEPGASHPSRVGKLYHESKRRYQKKRAIKA
ncbi:hypothetical protein VTL71DRAFT_3165 [Oculimacula yallundae]|uniref:Uncharacterized protein n=1 Tax=Oculimacula yallundae TaxID=86028 RepID=A0ABR4C6E9_9HELO